MSRDGRRSRRAMLAGVAGLTGIAGCATGPDEMTVTDHETETETTVTPTDSPTSTPDPEPIPFGYVFPTSGTFGTLGEDYASAVAMAIEDVNDGGGPLDRPVELHGKDNKGNGSLDRDRVEELVAENVRGFVHFTVGYSVGGIDRRAREHRLVEVFNVSTGVHDAGIVNGTKYVAQTGVDMRAAGPALGVCLGSDRFVDADTAAFLHPGYRPERIERARRAFDGTTVATVEYDPHGDVGYGDVLDELWADDPDAVGCVPHPDAIGSLLEQWAEGGYGGTWAFTEDANIRLYSRALGEDAPHMVRIAPDPERGTGWDRFLERFRGRWHEGAAAAYDATFLLALAAHRAGSATNTAIADHLRTVSRPPGQPVTVGEFGRAKRLLDEGTPVDYQGAAHAMDLSASLTPFVRWRVETTGSDGTVETVGHIDANLLVPQD